MHSPSSSLPSSYNLNQLSPEQLLSAADPPAHQSYFNHLKMSFHIPSEIFTLADKLATIGNNPNIVSHDEEGLISPSSRQPTATSGYSQALTTMSTGLPIEHELFEVSASLVGDCQIGHNHSSSPSDGEEMWYCSECGDGPMAIWNPCCANCGHAACPTCTVEGKK